MKRIRTRIFSIVMACAMLISLLPVPALAAGGSIPESGGTLSSGTYTLSENVTVTNSLIVGTGSSVTIDLNGHTLDMGGKTVTVNGNLTIQDKNGNGTLKGTTSDLITVNENASLKVSGGTIKTTGNTAVKLAYRRGINFTMTAGTISAAGTTVNAMMGTVSVTGGKILTSSSAAWTFAIDNIYGKASITIDAENGNNEAVYVTSVRGHKDAKLTFNSGIIGRVGGVINADDVISGLLETDVSSILPAGLICKPEGNYYRVGAISAGEAGAKINDALYVSAAVAAASLQEGQTLVLLADVTGDSSTSLLKITVPNAIVDLNGYNVTNENARGSAIEVAVSYGNSKDCTATIKNSGTAVSTITAAIPLAFSNGDSSKQMKANLEGNISLNSTIGQSVNLGTGAVMPYSEDAAKAYGNGGFKAVDAEGNAYIYGSLALAASNSQDGKIELLNDYSGSESLSVSSAGSYTLDLKGHTFASTHSEAALRIMGDSINLTVKNGKIISKNSDGADVGIGPQENPSYDNVTLVLNDVDLEVAGDYYGIVSNGTGTRNNLTLCNGTTLNVPNSVGIYWPSGDGLVSIDNSTITAHTGVQVCAGSLQITGENTKITATGAPEEKTEGDGVIMDGAAISIVNRDGYKEISSVKIQSGSYSSSSSSSAVKAYSFGSNKEEEAWENMNNIIEISGGTFSSIPVAIRECLSKNSGLKVNSDGSLSVVETTETSNVASVTIGGETNSYTNLADAITAVNAATSPVMLTLLQGQILTDTIRINKNVNLTIDLGGNALVGPESGYAIQFGSFTKGSNVTESDYTNTGTLTLKNGTITCNSGISNYFGSVVLDTGLTMNVTNRAVNTFGGKITVQGAKILSEAGFGVALFNSFYAFDTSNANMNHEKNKSAEFVMTSGMIDVSYYPITGNNLYSAGTTATITGGTLAADDNNPGIYWPMEGTLKVSGTARISGGTGIEAKMGTIEISDNAVVSGMGAYVSSEPENGGSNPEGSALMLSSQMYGQVSTQYKENNKLTVNITGGTLNSSSGNAVTVYNTEKQEAQNTNVVISGGILNGELAAIASVTKGENAVTTEDSQQTVSKSKTTLTVSGAVAPVSIDTNGKTNYYTSVAAAVADVDPNTESSTQISIFGNTVISTDVELTEKISLLVAPNVTLNAQVTSGESGKVLVTETDAQGNTVYKVVSAPTGPAETYAASITANGTTIYFDTLAHAVQTVQNGQTIQLLQANSEKLTISKALTFTLDRNGKSFTGSIAAGSGYVLSVNGNTYVITVYIPPYVPDQGGTTTPSGDYIVSVDRTTGGKVTVNPGRADKGDTVTITVKPNDGYQLDKLTVTDKSGDAVKLTNKGDGKYIFTMPSGTVDVKATFVKIDAGSALDNFLDVSDNAWYSKAVEFVVEEGLMSGTSGITFEPNTSMSRAMIWTVLAAYDGYNTAGGNPWYAPGQQWAMLNGVSDGTNPSGDLTREQLAVMLWRAAGSPNAGSLSGYTDASSVSDWAQTAMAWAVQNSILSGVGGSSLAPQMTATRAQVAVMLMQFVNYMEA